MALPKVNKETVVESAPVEEVVETVVTEEVEEPVVEQPPVEETVVEQPPVEETKEVAETRNVKVQVLAGRFSHPVTGTLFRQGSIVDVIDLDSHDNVFVRHQIEAGLFKIVE